ncbi:MAG: acyl-CoA dehydrogenase family protein [Sporolactobacillus sp.]
MVDLALTKMQKEWQEKTRTFVNDYIIPNASKYDQTGDFPQPIVEKAKEFGLLSIAAPETIGGPGLDALASALVGEELGKGCVGLQTTLGGNGLASYPVLFGGTEDQVKLYFEHILNGELAAFALTEPGAGSDPSAIQTTAVRKGDHYMINGTKCFCTNGGHAGVFTVFASTDPAQKNRGLSAFIVEADREGITVGKKENKMGIRASNTVEVIFNDVAVPIDHRIGDEGQGFKIAMKTLDVARLSVGASALGLSKRILKETIKFVQSEKRNGKPLAASQYIQFKLADMATRIEATEGLIYKTCYLKDSGEPYSKESAMSKTFATDSAMQIAETAVEIFGPYGYLVESIVEKLMRDAKVMQIYEGTNQIQRIVIANHVLNEKQE